MKLGKIVCPHCGARIDKEIGERKELYCSYCGGKIIVEDETSKSEHHEFVEKTVNINKNDVTNIVNEADVQRAKNERLTIKTGFILAIISIVLLFIAAFVGYRFSIDKTVKVPASAVEMSFRKAVLGKATEETNLIVMEQEIKVTTTLVKDGLFEWGIFQKNKDVTYQGKAVYTVNLKQMRDNDVVVDNDRKVVTVYVPKPEMYDLIINPDDITLGETSKGFLSFGEMKFTLEEAFYLVGQAREELREEAGKTELLEKATKIANNRVKELFQKAVLNVDSGYRLVIEMY